MGSVVSCGTCGTDPNWNAERWVSHVFAQTVFLHRRMRSLFGVLALTLVAACANGEFGPATPSMVSEGERLGELQAKIRRNPNDTKALNEFGDLQAANGQWNQAMGAYREAILIAPTNRDARLGLGEAQLALGDFNGALATATQLGSTDVRTRQLRAGALTGLNRLPEARALLEQTSRQEPRNLDVRSNLALVLGLSRDPTSYGVARATAFAPDADYTHVRNLILVGGLMGYEREAKTDGGTLGLQPDEVNDILKLGRRARSEGMRAFGIITQ